MQLLNADGSASELSGQRDALPRGARGPRPSSLSLGASGHDRHRRRREGARTAGDEGRALYVPLALGHPDGTAAGRDLRRQRTDRRLRPAAWETRSASSLGRCPTPARFNRTRSGARDPRDVRQGRHQRRVRPHRSARPRAGSSIWERGVGPNRRHPEPGRRRRLLRRPLTEGSSATVDVVAPGARSASSGVTMACI